MTPSDAQVITLALVFVAALGSIMYNNSRITDPRSSMEGRFSTMDKRFDDANTSINKRFDDANTSINKRFDDVNRHIDDKFALLSRQMKSMEENIMRMLGDHETRIQVLEGQQKQQ